MLWYAFCMKSDTVQRFIFENSAIRGEIVHLTHSFVTISQQRDYPAYVLQFLGETLAASVLLTSTIKYEGQLTMQIQQEGPLRILVAKCNNDLHIRGLAQWDETASHQQLQHSIRQGKLVITVQPNNHEPYQSIVAINDQPTAQVLEHYFVQSEQLPTRLWLAVNNHSAVGLLIQQLGSEEDEQQKSNLWEEVCLLTDTVSDKELLHLDNETLLHRLYHEHDVRLFEPKSVAFRCSCNLTKMENAILMMGQNEIDQLLKEFKEITVKCEYCNSEYSFTEEHVKAIMVHH